MKSLKKLIPAIAMLLVSAVLLGTSTFAWFSMNTRVTVTGMTVTTTVSSNLLIAATNSEENFKTSLSQTRTAVLEPVSTTTGTSFFYHSNTDVLGSGSIDTSTNPLAYIAYSEAEVADPSNALENTAADKTHFDKDFNSRYGFSAANTSNVAYGYVDYSFYIKATSSADDQALKLVRCNLLYDGAALTANDYAWRVAVFTQEVAAATNEASIGTLKTILKHSSAAYFDSTNAATSTSARGAVSQLGTAATISGAGDIDAGVTKYYKIVVRLWLEGEDSQCKNSTYASLTDEWTLDLAFDLGGANSAVTAIGSTTTPLA